jgi:hypothetical protein
MNLEKKPPGFRYVVRGLIAILDAEDDEDSDTREVSDGLCARLVRREGDDDVLALIIGTDSLLGV